MADEGTVGRCRSWLFLPGGDEEALRAGADSGADVVIQELEDSVAPEGRDAARALAVPTLGSWRRRRPGLVRAVRVNPLAAGGTEDLDAVMPGAPEVIMLPKVRGPDDVRALDAEVARREREHGLAPGSTALVPNIECARGLRSTFEIATASPRVAGCLVASEDMAASLGAERGPDGVELEHVRTRFHVECVAAGVVSIDCPFTFADEAGLRAETEAARRWGYTAKSAVVPAHVPIINQVLTPTPEETRAAVRVVEAFEAGRARGRQVGELDGRMIELPVYLNAQRVLARARRLEAAA